VIKSSFSDPRLVFTDGLVSGGHEVKCTWASEGGEGRGALAAPEF